MPININKGIGFIHIPRNGGTTVEHLMGVHKDRPLSGFGENHNHKVDLKFLFGKNLQHLGFFDLLDLTDQENRNLRWFSIIRYPEERFISFLCYMLQRPEALKSTKKMLGAFRTIVLIWCKHYFKKFKSHLLSLNSGRQVEIYSPHVQHLMPQRTYFCYGYSYKKRPAPEIELYPFTEIGSISTHIEELDTPLPIDKIPNRSALKPTPTPFNKFLIRLFTKIFYRKDYKLYKKVHHHWQSTGSPLRLRPLKDTF